MRTLEQVREFVLDMHDDNTGMGMSWECLYAVCERAVRDEPNLEWSLISDLIKPNFDSHSDLNFTIEQLIEAFGHWNPERAVQTFSELVNETNVRSVVYGLSRGLYRSGGTEMPSITAFAKKASKLLHDTECRGLLDLYCVVQMGDDSSRYLLEETYSRLKSGCPEYADQVTSPPI
jgi:hypothetical protein